MLYYLFDYLNKLDIPGAGVFGYVSFRALIAIILSLIISSAFGNYFINFLKKKQISEVQRDKEIDPFNVNKKGVPTMGGIIIITAIILLFYHSYTPWILKFLSAYSIPLVLDYLVCLSPFLFFFPLLPFPLFFPSFPPSLTHSSTY